MSKVIRKALTLLMCIILLMAVGCSDESKTSGPTQSAPSSSQATTTKNLAVGSIVEDDTQQWPAMTDGNTSEAAFAVMEEEESTLRLDLGSPKTFNEIHLYEHGGSKIEEYSIYIQKQNEWQLIYKQDEIGAYRICSFPPVTAQKIKLEITSTRKPAYVLNEIEVYNTDVGNSADELRVFSYFLGNADCATKDYGDVSEYFDDSTDLIYIGDMGWDKDCNLYYNRSNNTQSEEDYAARVAQTKACIAASGKNIRLWASVANPGDDTAQSLQGDKKAKLIKNLIDFALKYEFAGLDFDWEYPYSVARWNIYSEFLTDLKKEMDKHGLLLSVALGPWGVQLTPDAIAAIDCVQIMLYDLDDPDTGNHASFNAAVNSISYYTGLGFDLQQLNLGLAFYGKPNYAGYNYFVEHGCSHWDNALGDQNFNGCQLIRDKVVLAIREKLGGVMVWHYSCDVEESVTGLSLYDEIREVRQQYLVCE